QAAERTELQGPECRVPRAWVNHGHTITCGAQDLKVGAPTMIRRANSTIARAYNRLTAPGTSGSVARRASQAALQASAAISVTFGFIGFLDVRESLGNLALERGTYY